MDNFSIGYSVDDSQLINKVGEDVKIVQQLDKAVQGASSTFKSFDKAQEGTVHTIIGAKREMAQMKKQILDLTLTYQKLSDAEKQSDFGKQLQKKLTELKGKLADFTDAMGDANEEIKNMASDTQFADGMNLMVGTIGNVSSAMVALGGDGEHLKQVLADIAKIQTTIRAVESLTKAFQKQNLVLLSNPYVLAATAIAALGYTIYSVIDAQREEEQALKDTKPNVDDVASAYDKLNSKLQDTLNLNKRLRKESLSTATENLTTSREGFDMADKDWREKKKDVDDFAQVYDKLVKAKERGASTAYVVGGKSYDLRNLKEYAAHLKELRKEEQASLKLRNEYAQKVKDDRNVFNKAKEREGNKKDTTTKTGSTSHSLKGISLGEVEEVPFAKEGSVKYLKDMQSELQSQLDLLTPMDAEYTTIANKLVQINKELEKAQNAQELWTGKANTTKETFADLRKSLKASAKSFDAGMPNDYEEQLEAIAKKSEDLNSVCDSVSKLGSAFGQLGTAIGGTEGAWVSWAGTTLSTLAQTSAQIGSMIMQEQALAIAKGTEAGAGLPFPMNLAAIAAGVAAVVSIFASLPTFAEGGIIGGTSIGDYNLARVNGGEMILNGHQQENLFNILNGGRLSDNTLSGGDVHFKIKGEDLVGTLSNYNKKRSRV